MAQASMFFNASLLDSWLEEDIGHFDLTSTVLSLGSQAAQIRWVARSNMVVACSEEVARLVQHCGGRALQTRPSGSQLVAGETIASAEGPAQSA